MQPLARVLDPEALERLEGTRGRMRIEVPRAWAGGSVRIAVPRQLLCASCDGGGCDRCQRSGALRPPADGSLDVRLPEQLAEGIVVRVVHPFGADFALEVLLIEVRPGPATAGCALVSCGGTESAAQQHRAPRLLPMIALAVTLALVVLIWSLR